MDHAMLGATRGMLIREHRRAFLMFLGMDEALATAPPFHCYKHYLEK